MSHQGVEPTFSGFKVIVWSYLFSLIIHILNATAEKTKQIATITDVNHSVAMVTNKEAIRHSVALPWPHPSGEIPSAMSVTCCLGDRHRKSVGKRNRCDTDKFRGKPSDLCWKFFSHRKVIVAVSENVKWPTQFRRSSIWTQTRVTIRTVFRYISS